MHFTTITKSVRHSRIVLVDIDKHVNAVCDLIETCVPVESDLSDRVITWPCPLMAPGDVE